MSKRFTKRGYNQVMLRFLVDMDMKRLELVALVAKVGCPKDSSEGIFQTFWL